MRPSIIFFDEIDGLAPVRSSRQDQIHSSIVSTLLALMDGLDSRGEIIVIGATNRIEAIDPALRRPGRFDRELCFPLPTIKVKPDNFFHIACLLLFILRYFIFHWQLCVQNTVKYIFIINIDQCPSQSIYLFGETCNYKQHTKERSFHYATYFSIILINFVVSPDCICCEIVCDVLRYITGLYIL